MPFPKIPVNFRDLSGTRFERLVVIEIADRSNGRIRWRCACDCGGESLVLTSNLTLGRQKSCGCLNAEKRAARTAASRKSPEHKLAVRRRIGREWARRNKEYHQQRYAEEKADPERWERRLEIARKWSRKNPEHKRVLTRNRRSKLRGAEGSHSPADIRWLHDAQRGRCAICRSGLGGKYHVDHINPLSAGGSNDRRNLQLLCAPCNLNKWARDPITYMQSLGRLL